MEIRKATTEDLEEIQKLNLMLFEKEKDEYDDLLDLSWTFGNTGTKYFEKCLTEDDSCAFVVEDKGKIVGYLVGRVSKAVDYRNAPKMAELDNMFVSKDYRGTGVGRMLYETFIEWCRKLEVKMTRVEASAKNKEAIGFYRKMGMEDHTLVLEGKV